MSDDKKREAERELVKRYYGEVFHTFETLEAHSGMSADEIRDRFHRGEFIHMWTTEGVAVMPTWQFSASGWEIPQELQQINKLLLQECDPLAIVLFFYAPRFDNQDKTELPSNLDEINDGNFPKVWERAWQYKEARRRIRLQDEAQDNWVRDHGTG